MGGSRHDRTRSLDSTCLGAAASFETAHNAYNKANGIWSDCIDNILAYGSSTSGAVDDCIHAQWSKAASAIINGEKKLDRPTSLQAKAQAAATST